MNRLVILLGIVSITQTHLAKALAGLIIAGIVLMRALRVGPETRI